MKKKILLALTTALVLGTTSQTFAAPIDDEVTELRARLAQLERRIAERDARMEYESERVDDLERDINYRNSQSSWADKFNLTGELRYRFWGIKHSPDVSNLQLRLFPTFQIDDHFAVKSRITGSYDMKNDSNATASMTYAYLESKFDNFQVNAGKMPLFTNADGGLVADDFFSGLQFITGTDALKFYVNGGHWNKTSADYIGAEAVYDVNDRVNVGAGYHYFKESDRKAQIAAAGTNIGLTDTLSLNAAVAHNSKASSHKTAYNVEADYRGAKRDEKGSWGAFAAYRYIGGDVGIAPTYDSFAQVTDKKGFDIGASFTPYNDTLLKLSYFHGKGLTTKENDRTIFARASIFF